MLAATADPRRSNHGGHNTPTPPPDLGLGTRFDWYEATFEALDDERIGPHLALALGARTKPARGRNGYGHGTDVFIGDDVLATVHGGSARPGEAHVTITGSACDAAVPVVRQLWPAHRVSRVDSALDFTADFEQLDALAVGFARARGLKHSLTTNSEGGATRYIGSPASENRMRLYKKSEQLIALHPERAAEIPAGIVRAEFVSRPGKRGIKEAVSLLSSDDVWGLSQWGAVFAQTVLGFEPARTSTHFRRPSEWSRSLHYLGEQYGPAAAREAEAVGAYHVAGQVLAALGLPSLAALGVAG